MLWDLYLSREFMENMEEGTDSFDDNNDATSDDAEDISDRIGDDLLTGLKKRKYQSLNSNCTMLEECMGWWRVKGSRRILWLGWKV